MTGPFDMCKTSLSRAGILSGVEDSLSRLQTDYIDLYLSHIDDENTPLERTLSAYDELIKAGKVPYIRASNITKDRLEEALQITTHNNLPAYATLQPHYNLYHREDYEGELQDFCVAHEIGVFTYFSLAQLKEIMACAEMVLTESRKQRLNEIGNTVINREAH